jgi:hypothetical protein
MKIGDITKEINKRSVLFWDKIPSMDGAIKSIDKDNNLILKKGDITLKYKAILIGTHVLASQEFHWSWGNNGFPSGNDSRASVLFDFGNERKMKSFTSPIVSVDETLIMINNSTSLLDDDSDSDDDTPVSKYTLLELMSLSGMRLKSKMILGVDVGDNTIYLSVVSDNPLEGSTDIKNVSADIQDDDPEYTDNDVYSFIANFLNKIVPNQWHTVLADIKFDKENRVFGFRIVYRFNEKGGYNVFNISAKHKNELSKIFLDLINIIPSAWDGMRFTLQSDNKFETEFKYSGYTWMDAYNKRYLLKDMETGHLFYTLKMCWNHMVDEDIQIKPAKDFDFLNAYSNGYLKEGIYKIIKEIGMRKDISDDFSLKINDVIKAIKSGAI